MPLFGPPNVEKLRAKGNVKGLIKALCSRDMSVRQAATEALDTLDWQPDRDQIGALYWIEKRRWDKCIEIGEPSVKPLIIVLSDVMSSEGLRQSAAEALGQIGDSRAVEPLVAALEDKSKLVCIQAAKALGQMRNAKAAEPLIDLLKDEYSSDLPNAAIEALVKIGEDAVKPLIVVLTYGSSSTRRRAAKALGQIGDARAVEPLISIFKEGLSLLYDDAIEALVNIGAPAVEPLINALADKDDYMREGAAKALGQIGDARAVEPLIVALEEYDDHIRRGAAKALGQIGDDRAVEPLVATFKEEWSYVTDVAIEALVKIGAPAVEPLIVALADKNESVRERAAKALRKIGKPAVGQLLKVLKDHDPGVRAAAASALERVCDTEVVESLVPLLRDSDLQVRKAALEALQNMGWKPVEDVERAAFWIVSGDVNRLGELNCQAIKQLLNESMEWQMDISDWYIKGQIAKLLVRPGILASNSDLARAVDELESYAKKCKEELDRMVHNPQQGSKDLDLGKHEGRIFGDYENLLVAATSYCVTTYGDGSGGTYYSYDMSSTQRAVEKLCQIETPVSTNLLHHISRLRDISVPSRDAEVEYSAEHPSGMVYQTEILSFKSQRRAAKKELARRGNPDYDLSAYKAEECWRIPT